VPKIIKFKDRMGIMELKSQSHQQHTFRHIKNISTLKLLLTDMLSVMKLSRAKKKALVGKQDKAFTYTPMGISPSRDQ
jgi:hypothetical protein